MREHSQSDLAPVPHVRAVVGGALMGLANLVPGVSGGTMLLAAGVYRRFVDAVAEVSTLRLCRGSVVTLGLVVGTAGAAIVLGARPVKSLVLEHRWVMYSLFIGLTLGGAPALLRLARPWTVGAWGGLAGGVGAMLALGFAPEFGGPRGGDAPGWLLLVAGVAGASAMVLPGVSGAYLLLALGVYVPILSAVDETKEALQAILSGDPAGWTAARGAAGTLAPVAVGVVVGVAGVSNLVRWLLRRFEKPTLGTLLGLLLGAAAGLWPFRAPVEPQVGDVVQGRTLRTEAQAAAVAQEAWPVQAFTPDAAQIGVAALLVGAGFGCTWGLERFGRRRRDSG